MKKIISYLTVCFFLFTGGAIASTGAKQIKVIFKNIRVFVDNKEVKPTAEPFLYNNQVMVPASLIKSAGYDVKWNAATNKLEINKVVPPTPPPSPIGASRTTPAPVGTTMLAKWTDLNQNYQANIKISQIIRGQQAWELIQAANMFNDPPKAGNEYILAKVYFNYLTGPKDTQVELYSGSFTAVSSIGRDYEHAIMVEPYPSIDTDLYPGAYHEGWVAFEVAASDQQPLMTFGRDYNGKNGAWFKIY